MSVTRCRYLSHPAKFAPLEGIDCAFDLQPARLRHSQHGSTKPMRVQLLVLRNMQRIIHRFYECPLLRCLRHGSACVRGRLLQRNA